jgi:hypothetical protein
VTTPGLDRLNKLHNRDLYSARVRRKELALTAALLTDADTQQDFDIGAALPAGAIVLGGYVNVATKFQNEGDTDTTTVDVGVKGGDVDSIIDGADLKTVALTDATVGAKAFGFYGAVTLQARVDSDVNLNTITAGAATIVVAYVDPTDADLATS